MNEQTYTLELTEDEVQMILLTFAEVAHDLNEVGLAVGISVLTKFEEAGW